MNSIHIDKFGKEVSAFDMLRLAVDKDYCRIKKSDVAHIDGTEIIQVSTVWLPGVLSSTGPKPVFETMIFGGPEDGWTKRYSDIEEARRGHDYALHLSTGMRDKDKM